MVQLLIIILTFVSTLPGRGEETSWTSSRLAKFIMLDRDQPVDLWGCPVDWLLSGLKFFWQFRGKPVD